MDTCPRHEIEIELDADGVPFCAICEAEEIDAGLARNEYPATAEGYDFYVPALGKEATEKLKQVTIRFPTHDIERARILAKSKKMPYQRYIKTLLSEALDREEDYFLGRKVGGE